MFRNPTLGEGSSVELDTFFCFLLSFLSFLARFSSLLLSFFSLLRASLSSLDLLLPPSRPLGEG